MDGPIFYTQKRIGKDLKPFKIYKFRSMKTNRKELEGNLSHDEMVTKAKIEWLRKHLKSVEFKEIHIVPYGTPKHEVVKDKNGILFDDEEGRRHIIFYKTGTVIVDEK